MSRAKQVQFVRNVAQTPWFEDAGYPDLKDDDLIDQLARR
jgi:hypothetical protein